MKTLLAILAHPDDESFGPGGTLARYAAAGVSVHYLCATRGESGTVDAERMGAHKTVADLRASELACAAQALGLAGVHFLGYRDSGMPGSADNAHADSLFAAPLDEAAARIIEHIDRLKPDVILAHDQFGGYGHPDHIKLHQATLRAYELRYGVKIDVTHWRSLDARPHVTVMGVPGAPADPAPQLYFPTFSNGLIKFGVRILPLFRQNPRKFGRNKDIDLVKIMGWELPTTAVLDTKAYAATKDIASACHASQRPSVRGNPVMSLLFRIGRGRETFSRVYPSAQPNAARETALGGLA